MAWNNSDSLRVKFGKEEGTVGIAGEYEFDGPARYVEITLDLTTLTSTAGTIIEDNVSIPSGARLEKVEVIAITAATSGGSATLDVGLSRTDRTTQIDYDGIVAALAKTAYDVAGETNVITVGSTGAGALLGTTTSNVGMLTANYNTAAYTAGKLAIRLYWSKPT